MPGCSIGRNIQKYKGSGASTLQDALENGNVATTSIQTSGLSLIHISEPTRPY